MLFNTRREHSLLIVLSLTIKRCHRSLLFNRAWWNLSCMQRCLWLHNFTVSNVFKSLSSIRSPQIEWFLNNLSTWLSRRSILWHSKVFMIFNPFEPLVVTLLHSVNNFIKAFWSFVLWWSHPMHRWFTYFWTERTFLKFFLLFELCWRKFGGRCFSWCNWSIFDGSSIRRDIIIGLRLEGACFVNLIHLTFKELLLSILFLATIQVQLCVSGLFYDICSAWGYLWIIPGQVITVRFSLSLSNNVQQPTDRYF